MTTTPDLAERERQTIILGIWAGIASVLLAFAFAALTASEALLLDGVFSLINVALALLTLKVSSLVMRPADEEYPFGYWHYETFLNLGKGAIILLVGLFAALSAALAILNGGRDIQAGWATVYAVIACLLGFAVAIFFEKRATQCNSNMLRIDAKNWRIDGILSGGIAVAFVVIVILEYFGINEFKPYADPMLVILLVIATIPVPLKIIVQAWHQLLAKAVPNSLRDNIKNALAIDLANAPIEKYYLRIAEAGRVVYVQLYLVSNENITLSQQDDYREQLFVVLQQMVSGINPNMVLDIVFTQNPIWVKRSVRTHV